ncbi:MAG: type IX secretion system sortase PorU [Spirosomataceae bacterium]
MKFKFLTYFKQNHYPRISFLPDNEDKKALSIGGGLGNRRCGQVFLFLLLSFSTSAQSVLSKGNWYKIGVTESGIHKIDAKFLQNAGVNIANVNPQNIKIYGNGGAMLPQANRAKRPKDLIENAIFVEGEADGKFDTNDFILFYGESPHTIRYDSTGFSHQINYYSNTTYYFLTFADAKGLRISNRSSLNSPNKISTFDDFIFHESEQKNLTNSGREWVGESFVGSTEKGFDLKVEGILPNSEVKITSSIIGASPISTLMSLRLNSQIVGSQTLEPIELSRYAIKGIENKQKFIAKTDALPSQKLTYQFDGKSNSASVAYLNYFEIQLQRNLQVYASQTFVRSINSNALDNADFTIANANNQLKIWDITSPQSPINQGFQLNGNQANFGVATKKSYRTFILFNNGNTLEPKSIAKIPNQHIQILETPDLLIITANNWKVQANRLAEFRQKNDGLKTLVVTTDEVYNEFSSGKEDLTAIRDFARFLWLKNPQKLKYLLLFGDTSFDYKNVNQFSDINPQNLIPTYESRESFHPVNTFSSDDFFGFFEESEGEWNEDYSSNHTLEIGVGRLPVNSVEEAEHVVDKLIHYSTSKRSFGRWRSRLSFVADDIDQYRYDHQLDAEVISGQVFKQNKNLIINKLYLDIFPQISTPNGATSPAANRALNRAVNEGSLIVNYNGHGDETGWTEEKVLTIGQIQSWRNLNNMPIFLTATCEFGRYDNPAVVSGAELAMLSRRGAAIGLLTTTRPVYSNTNNLLSQEFYKSAFTFENGRLRRLGDIFRETKNNSISGVFNRNFSLLGDPSMALAYPQEAIKLTKVNGQNPEKQQLKALSKVVLEGEILSNKDQKTRLSGFDGTIFVSIFDKPKQLNTLGSKGTKMSYSAYPNQLFEGRARVQNGVFSITFVVPKDIDYELGKGRIEFYALNADSTLDAIGSDEILIGGSETNVVADIKPPQIQLFMDSESFKDGGVVEPNTTLIAKISDENGINLSRAGIGHEMILTLNDTLQVIANEYFSNEEDYTKGVIRYNFTNLPEGNYAVKSKVWDNHNNSGEASLKFIVETNKFEIKSAVNFPNPFSEQTQLKVEHNREGEDIAWEVGIYDVLGKLVYEFKDNCYNCDSILNLSPIELPQWLAKGMYFYRILAKTTSSETSLGGRMILK